MIPLAERWAAGVRDVIAECRVALVGHSARLPGRVLAGLRQAHRGGGGRDVRRRCDDATSTFTRSTATCS